MQKLYPQSRQLNTIVKSNSNISPATSESLKLRPINPQIQKTSDNFRHGFFKENRLLTLLTKEGAAASPLPPLLQKVFLRPGAAVQTPDERAEYVYFPETAVISEYQMLEDGASVEVAMIGREGAAGLVPLLGAEAAVNWAQVTLPGTVYKVKGEALRKYLFGSASLMKLVFGYIEEYVRQLSQRSVCNSFHSVKERFCGWLLMLSERLEDNRFRLTQEQIAAVLGVHRPSLTLVAQNLREDKIIDYRRGGIVINDHLELKRQACYCHGFESLTERI